MANRHEHTFQFKASEISGAATREENYHRERQAYWEEELRGAMDRVRETSGVKIEEQVVTGGSRPVVSVDYGDHAAYIRMQDAWVKAHSHREAAERFETDAKVYMTQDVRTYELSTDDVHHYRLGGGPRET
jgi:hypothetical protein